MVQEQPLLRQPPYCDEVCVSQWIICGEEIDQTLEQSASECQNCTNHGALLLLLKTHFYGLAFSI